jgi:hypothetical protein
MISSINNQQSTMSDNIENIKNINKNIIESRRQIQIQIMILKEKRTIKEFKTINEHK